MSGRSPQMDIKRATSPTKRSQLIKPAQTLTFREVRDILDSCRSNFNAEMKKKSLSPNTDRTLRAKTLNGKVFEKASCINKPEMKGLLKSPTSHPPMGAKIPMAVVREILQTCIISDHHKSNIKVEGSSKSARVSPSDRMSKSRLFKGKSSSAPASPSKGRSQENKRKGSPMQKSASFTSSKRMKTEEMKAESDTSNSENTPADLKTPPRAAPSILHRQKRKAAPMDEVMKLHQDEGVMHLLHSLPTSRRKTQTTLFTSSFGVVSTGHTPIRRPSTQSDKASPRPLTIMAASNTGVNHHEQKQFPQKRNDPKKNNLIKVSMVNLKKLTPEELMNPKTLELLKKLPKKDYVHLWSSTARYKLTEETIAVCKSSLLKQSSVSPDSNADSDISSASTMAARPKKVGDRMLTNVTTVTKTYKDILIRSYPNFVAIIMAPTTTGMKFSFNVNVLEEIIDALALLKDMEQCKAVLLTGLGQVYSQGVDLTTLTHDSPEKQRKSAEALAGAIRSLIRCMLNYPKLLVAGVNGANSGLGVMLLPYFDIVYANDKAMLRADYCRFGQIPEAFASVTIGRMMLNEMLLLGRPLSAEEGLKHGLVSSVLWPDKFLEDIVPRIELLEDMSMVGVQATKVLMKERLKKKVMDVMEEESKQLVKCWTVPEFAKNMRNYLKSSNDIVFQ